MRSGGYKKDMAVRSGGNLSDEIESLLAAASDCAGCVGSDSIGSLVDTLRGKIVSANVRACKPGGAR